MLDVALGTGLRFGVSFGCWLADFFRYSGICISSMAAAISLTLAAADRVRQTLGWFMLRKSAAGVANRLMDMLMERGGDIMCIA